MMMAFSFRSFQFPSMYQIPSYQEWMEQNDLGPGYRYHRRVLQYLQWQCARSRWILKAPSHIFGIDEIFANYPDAGLIHIHRDPLEVTASLASLTATLYAAFSEGIDLQRIGRDQVESLHRGLERYLQARDREPARQRNFLDIDYRDFMADPMKTARRIYDFFGIPLTESASIRMERFLMRNPRGKHGRHRYSLGQFGIDHDAEARRFQSYRDRFGV